MKERERTQQKLQDIRAQAKDLEYALKRLLETGTVISPELDEQIQKVIEQREQNSDQYDDSIVRQMIECIKVHSDGKLTIIFGGGYEIEESLK